MTSALQMTGSILTRSTDAASTISIASAASGSLGFNGSASTTTVAVSMAASGSLGVRSGATTTTVAIAATAAGVLGTGSSGSTAVVVSMAASGTLLNSPPTSTVGAVQNISVGNTATLTGSAVDTDGTIANFTCVFQPIGSTCATAPTIGPGVLSNLGTANAQYSFPISNLVDGIALFTIVSIDNNGGTSAPLVQQINRTQVAPSIYNVVSSNVTRTTPAGGTDAAAFNNQAAVPILFQTPGPPGTTSMELFYQPMDVAVVPPYFGLWCALTPDAVTSNTVFVELRMGGVLISTVSRLLRSTIPVLVDHTCNATEMALIPVNGRSTPTVKGRT